MSALNSPMFGGAGAEDEDYEHGPYCSICGQELESIECHVCHSEGGRHPYEDLPLEYDPNEWEPCEECKGEGYYWQCPNVPHKEEQDATETS